MVKPLKSARFATPMLRNAKTLSRPPANNDAAFLDDPPSPLSRLEISDRARLRVLGDCWVLYSHFPPGSDCIQE
jgi:hypothetical protein